MTERVRPQWIRDLILYTMIKTGTAFDPSKLGNPALIRQRKERSLRKQAALLGFSLQPAKAGAVS